MKGENCRLLKEGFQCLFFLSAAGFPLRLWLFDMSLLQAAEGLLPLLMLLLFLPLRSKMLRIDLTSFFEAFEEE